MMPMGRIGWASSLSLCKAIEGATHSQTCVALRLEMAQKAVVTKVSTETHDVVDRFFSSIFGKLVLGVALFALALVSGIERQAFPM